MYDAVFSSPADVFVDDEIVFQADLRGFSTNDAKLSTNLRAFQTRQAMFQTNLAVFLTNQSKFQARKERSLSKHRHVQTQQLVCLHDQAVSTNGFALQPSPEEIHDSHQPPVVPSPL